ncbi:alpha-ketoglutarate-dependent dioxygenase AlkB [Mucilaginibacter sp. cycad4]|uniref:alpha-ketoglutarate-dependent dioxygenase AlkB n=1 Tax=Mucilaginibacter sp. cycad4 TaxID=3342096 RepID=UPI002AAAA604|nr:alpha-ketoglutarate-dependent dioxygenase AlkB [Mucilaginibacter gossypii]WPU99733.1 alpha-ketoglutarate-dependent dioxygenase AlkB [Mucilaginibacter gossypii]
MNGILYVENFIKEPIELFDFLTVNTYWDERMAARKTASYGEAYNYSQISYPYKPLLPQLEVIISKLAPIINFTANNCLINYYLDGRAKMGFHSDQTDILYPDTGVAIVSVGEPRTLRFRNIENKDEFVNYKLTPGSLIYMTQEVQTQWQHTIPPSDTENGRISLTFRKIRNNLGQ